MSKPSKNRVEEAALRDAMTSWLIAPSGAGCVFAPTISNRVRDPRPDAVGIRHTGGQHRGDFEVIAVHIRQSEKRFTSFSGEASSHSIHADRIYFACYLPTSEFSEEQISVALHLGSGLIRIDRDLGCHRTVPAPLNHPIAKARSDLLYQLGLVSCQLCGVVYSSSVSDDDALLWNEIWADRFGRLRNESVYDRRYLCPDCVRNIRNLSQRDREGL